MGTSNAKRRERQPAEGKKNLKSLSDLKHEANKLFVGLQTVTKKGAAKKAEETKEETLFDKIRILMVLVREENWKRAYEYTREMVSLPSLPYLARGRLIPIGQNLGRLYRNEIGEEVLRASERTQFIESVNSSISDAVAVISGSEEEHDKESFDFQHLRVDLPDTIENTNEVVVVENVQVLVNPDRNLPRRLAQKVTEGIFLVPCTLVGASSELSEEEAFKVAEEYTKRKLKLGLTQKALFRADSDAYWFPAFAFGFIAERVQFADQVNLSGSTVNIAEAEVEASVKLLRLRSVRRDFESANAELIERLAQKQRLYRSATHDLKVRSVSFLQTYGLPYDANEDRLVSRLREVMEAELLNYSEDFVERNATRRRHEERMVTMRETRAELFKLRAAKATYLKQAGRVQKQIEGNRVEKLDPHGAVGRAIVGQMTDALAEV